MKKLFVIAAACLLTSAGAFAQGQINFQHINTAEPIIDPNGVNLDGDRFQAILWVGASADSLSPVGQTGFLAGQGTGAGFFVGGNVTVDGIDAGANAFVQIAAFDTESGADFDSALIRGTSNVFEVTLGGTIPGQPPTLPAALDGLQGFQLEVIPEPSTVLLGLLGAAALLFRRRK